MKGNAIILFLTLFILELCYAHPRVSINTRSQAVRRHGKGHKVLRDDFDDSTTTEDEHNGTVKKLNGADEDDSEDEEEEVKKLGAVGDSDYEDSRYVARPLIAGDTFTARELLPVAEKLFEKIEHPGEGKGIISSSTQPEELSDKLFKAFFMTSDRIVKITDDDLIGLDTLQRLALVGERALRTNIVEQTNQKKKKKVVEMNGQRVVIDDQPRNTSELKVLTKKTLVKVPKFNKSGKIGRNRRVNKLIKKLGKNRHLVVQRKNLENNNKSAELTPCRWSYECKDPINLDTCRLNENCTPRKPGEKLDHNEYITSKVEVDPKLLSKFRKFLSINALDEEVEKIIENRILKYKPKNMGSAENLESLSEYFRKIVLVGDKEVTMAMGDEENVDTTEKNEEDRNKLKADEGKVIKLKVEDIERKLKRKGRYE